MASDQAAAAALGEDIRRRIYLRVRSLAGPATREETAAALGISRRSAAFHLDYLVEAGILKAHYAHDPGRGGPGAGRPAKRYTAAMKEISLSVPERRYDLVARIALDALRLPNPSLEAATELAHERGRALGRDVAAVSSGSGPEAILRRLGYDPSRENGTIALRNCPFEGLARDGGTVCALNNAFLSGLGETFGMRAKQNEDGECCTELRSV